MAPLLSDAHKLKKVQSERRLPMALITDPVNFEETRKLIESDSERMTDLGTCLSPVDRYLHGFFEASAVQK